MEDALFYIVSVAMLFFALMTISRRNPVNSAICLVCVFFFMSALFILLQAFFLATIQVLIYAGAIMVLFLFVIMLLNVTEEEKHKLHWYGIGASIVIGTALILEFMFVLHHNNSEGMILPHNTVGLTENVGKLLFSKYLLPFEMTSLLLLVAMIGVIILSKKETKS